MMQSQPRERRLVKLTWLVDPYAVTIRLDYGQADFVVRSGLCGSRETEYQCFFSPEDFPDSEDSNA